MILKNDLLEVTTKSSGAELTSIKLNGYEYLWSGDKKYWGRQAPVLFPIVGGLKNGKAVIDGKEYFMGRHGFARDMEFEEVSESENKVTYLLKSNEETLRVYPYKFELHISYELIKNRVKVTYTVNNIDDKVIYFSIGAHPAFRCPIDDNGKFQDYYIEFEKEETQKYIAQPGGLVNFEEKIMLDSSNKLELNKDVFKEIDTYIFNNLNSEIVTLKSDKSDKSVSIHFKNFPFFGIWTKPDDAPFICLEPWYGINDRVDSNGIFSEKLGVLSLDKGESFSCSYEIEVK